MTLSIIINQLYTNSDKIIYVYFSPFPYYIYNKSNDIGNLALSGVGLGLIQCQKMFWFYNFGMMLFLYYKNNNLYYTNNFILFLFYCLYTLSLYKTMYLLSLFNTFIEYNQL
jgi:hypothetical protein